VSVAFTVTAQTVLVVAVAKTKVAANNAATFCVTFIIGSLSSWIGLKAIASLWQDGDRS
jgi:hypothetical protein